MTKTPAETASAPHDAPPRAVVQTTLALRSELVARIDAWAAANQAATRDEAIAALVEIALATTDSHAAAPGLRARAASLAGQQIDRMADATASASERDDRKSRLTEGPAIFRDVRRDRPER